MRLRLVGVSAEYVASVTGKVGASVGGACTLLGPEGPGADGGLRIRCWWLFLEGLLLVVAVAASGEGVPPVL